mmetsp:Transcript_3317/g.6238  ORF Transcript_3317/g.6238 Transcript_3317/m.6238 type:complete len:98 (+) Transcript_3317:2044-2337(+)
MLSSHGGQTKIKERINAKSRGNESRYPSNRPDIKADRTSVQKPASRWNWLQKAKSMPNRAEINLETPQPLEQRKQRTGSLCTSQRRDGIGSHACLTT